MTDTTRLATAEHCCCERFLDGHGHQRIRAHACCPRHWRDADVDS